MYAITTTTAMMTWKCIAWFVCLCVCVCVRVRVRGCVNPERIGIPPESSKAGVRHPRRAPSHVRLVDVIAGAVRAVMESLSVAVHM